MVYQDSQSLWIWHFQIDYLQQANRDAERRLRESTISQDNANQKVIELTEKNEELANELRNVDRLAHKLQADKNNVIWAADKDVTDAKVELQETSREVASLDLELEQLRQVKHKIRRLWHLMPKWTSYMFTCMKMKNSLIKTDFSNVTQTFQR